MYDRLQSEMTIGCLRIANRVVMPAMGVNLAAPSGGVTDEIIAFYEARAAGGAGLIITEVTRVTEGAGISDPCQLSACRISDIPGLQRLTDAIDKYETKIFIQLQHPGREASPLIAEICGCGSLCTDGRCRRRRTARSTWLFNQRISLSRYEFPQ